MENLGSVTDEMNKHIAFIYNQKTGIESYNDEINGTMDVALRTMAEGQAQSIPVQQMKVQVLI